MSLTSNGPNRGPIQSLDWTFIHRSQGAHIARGVSITDCERRRACIVDEPDAGSDSSALWLRQHTRATHRYDCYQLGTNGRPSH